MIDEQNGAPADKPEECNSCGFKLEELRAYASTRYLFSGRSGPSHKWLCGLCAGTMAGNASEYPEQYPEHQVLATICYVGNAILAAIKAKG